MTEKQGLGETASDVIAASVRDRRKRMGWKIADLAARCAEIGEGAEALTENVIENIESGRRRNGKRTRHVTVEELIALSHALGVTTAVLCPQLNELPPGIDLSLVAQRWHETFDSVQALQAELEQELARHKNIAAAEGGES